MDNREKLQTMEKMVRQLEDLVNSETSVVKKIGQLEAENINFGNRLLEKQLPEVLSKSEETLEIATSLFNEFTEVKDKFIIDNKLEEVLDEA